MWYKEVEMKKIDALIIINGKDFSKEKFLVFKNTNPDAEIIVADGGFNYLADLVLPDEDEIIINLLLGDFDSIEKGKINNLTIIKKKQFPPDKDFTDFQLVLEECLKSGFRKIAVFAAGGGRVDHFLANLENCSYYCSRGLEIDLVAENENIYFRNESFQAYFPKLTTVSFLAGTEVVSKLNLSGFKYELENYDLKRSFPLGVSNQVTRKMQHVSFIKGVLIIIENFKDE